MLSKFRVPAIVKSNRHYQPGRMLIFKLAGKTALCSVREAVEGQATAQRFTDILAGFSNNCHLLEHDPAGFNLWRTPRGDIWTPHLDDPKELCWVLTEVDVGVYGSGVVSVQQGDTVFDCGANVGLFTRNALAAGADLVVAIEPAPSNAECLRRNLRTELANGRVILKEVGLWDGDTVLPFSVSARSSLANSFVLEGDNSIATAPLPLTTVDRITSELALPRIDFIKMDIEGAEQRALRGARNVVVRDLPKMAVGVEHDFPTPAANARAVRDIVLEISSAYTCRCGLCIQGTDGVIAPQVLWFGRRH
jgi:FkbM family methyltransferase